MITCPVEECSREFRDKRGLHSHLRTHGLAKSEIQKLANEVNSDPQPSQAKYPDDWTERREQVLRRDNYECQECGSGTGKLHVHHQTPLSEGGSNDLSNLITLCRDCHSEKHPDNPMIDTKSNRTERTTLHHGFRKQLCKEYSINYETAKKYDHLHKELLKERSGFPFDI